MRKIGVLIAFSAVAAFAQNAPTVTSVYNQYSYSTTLCPGLLAIVAGTGFGADASKVTVTVGGKPAYIFGPAFYFTSTAFSVEIPFEVATGPANVVVTVSGVQSQAFSVTIAAVSPAFQAPGGAATGPAVVVDAKTFAQITYAAPATANQLLTVFAIGLGATTPATQDGIPASGQTFPLNPVSPTPKVTVGGVNASVTFAASSQYGGGTYQINFMVPATVQGTAPLVITLQGVSSSNMITLPVAGLGAVTVNGSFASPGTIAPGSIASVFANSLGASTLNISEFPNTSSEGVQVTFNGTPAPMFHLIPAGAPAAAGAVGSSGQIDLLVPDTLPTTGTVNVQLTTSTANFANYTLNMVPALPSMFRFTDPKTSNAYAIVQFLNSAWVVLPTVAATDIGFPVCAASTSALTECGEPANIGDYLTIYLTGLGLATVGGSPTGATLPTGQVAPASGNPLYETPTMPTVTIGGITASVLFSGLSPGVSGEYQLDVQVPTGVASGDSVPVVVTMMGQSDTANISIQPSRVPPLNQ